MAVLVAVGHWWAFVLRGIVAVLFGILTFVMPGMALLTLVFLFGAYAIVEGAFNIVAAIRKIGTRRQPSWALLLEGIVSVIAGVLAYVIPGVTALSLLLVIAAWSVVTGVLEIVAAIRLRREIKGEWLMALSGVLSVVFGLLLMAFPGAGALAVLFWIGAYAIVFGAMLIALGVKLRNRVRADRTRVGLGDLAPTASR